MSNENKQLADLITRHFDALLNADEEKHLAALLEKSADARRMFARYMRLEGETIELGIADCLNEQSADGVLKRSTPSIQSVGKRRQPSMSLMVGWLALAVVVALTIYGLRPDNNGFDVGTGDSDTVQTSPQAVAHFSRLVSVTWQDEADLEVGEAIYPGTIELREGLAEVEFENGAVVIIEGPARLDVAAADRAFLHHGRLRSIVPPEAYGFTVESTDVRIVDLGTEFGFEVDPDGLAEVHVFDGEIEMSEVHDHDTKHLLSAGQAVQIERTGWRREIPADHRAFVDSETLEAHAASYVAMLRNEVRDLTQRHRELKRERKQRESNLRNDPELIELRIAADKARHAADSAANSDPSVVDTLKRRKAVQKRVDDQVESALSKTKQGKQLLLKLAQVERDFSELKSRTDGIRKNGKEKQKLRRMSTEYRDLHKRRSDLKAQLRQEGGKLRRSNRKIRESIARLNKSKRKLDGLLQKSDAAKLRKASDAKRREFLAAQHRILKDDAILSELQRQIEDTSSRLRQIRRKIHHARIQTAEDSFENEVIEPDTTLPQLQSTDSDGQVTSGIRI